MILTIKGPLWWHTSQTGLFFNSLHFWSVQVFFFTIFIHFGASFFSAAWRGGRGLTWVFGTLAFLTAVLTGFTGYILQSNYESQWISQQGKDAFNAIGLGWVLNAMSFDNVVGWHIALLPIFVALFLVGHLLWVRRHGVVPPFPAEGTDFHGEPQPGGPSKRDASSGTSAGTTPRKQP